MLKRLRLAIVTCIALFMMNLGTQAQDASGLYSKAYNIPDKFFAAIHKKSQSLQEKLAESTEKYLNKLERHELKMQQRMARKDSALAKATFGDVRQRYQGLRLGLTDSVSGQPLLQTMYSGRLDSMKTAFQFLNATKVLGNSASVQGMIASAMQNYGQLQNKLNQTEAIRKAITERQTFLRQRLEQSGLAREFKKYQQEVYYYREQLDEYKRIVDNPQKLEARLLSAVRQLPAFRKFFSQNSFLGNLFALPGSEELTGGALNGMQTRGMLMQELEQRLGSGPSMQQAMSASMNQATSAMKEVKDRISRLGSNGQDLDLPDFKPNEQKKKSLLQRLELGTNMQSAKTNYLFPSTTDLGISVGYKLSPKAVTGIGMSYKVGWGTGWQHIRMTNEGIGFRTFAEWKLKGNIWITGGGELNYYSAFRKFDILKDFSPWQKSALAGLSKKYKAKKMNGSVQVLYDFLHNKQTPVAQPFVFRMGYGFK